MGTPYAYVLFPMENAEAFTTGKLAGFVGVGAKALDQHML